MKTKEEILKMIHLSLSNGIRAGKAKEPRKWVEDKGLSIDLTGACFNSGQMHHRREEDFIKELASVGFLKENGINGKKEGNPPAYTSFGKEAIVFALKNKSGEVVNFYAIRIHLEAQTAEYLNQEGIYPSYPSALTKKLYITKNILDAATLLESKIMDNRDAVIALHDGEFKEQHFKVIENLKELEEILFIN
ncbi:MAG: hypothetical protein M3Q58_04230 [Bacteroidota bacterium]|nr:hypothetical protein [Bacteroidota bacterium]